MKDFLESLKVEYPNKNLRKLNNLEITALKIYLKSPFFLFSGGNKNDLIT